MRVLAGLELAPGEHHRQEHGAREVGADRRARHLHGDGQRHERRGHEAVDRVEVVVALALHVKDTQGGGGGGHRSTV